MYIRYFKFFYTLYIIYKIIMNIDFDRVFEVIGGRNKYQYMLLICVFFTWFSVDFIAVSFPLLLFYPELFIKDKKLPDEDPNKVLNWCKYYKDNNNDATFLVKYNNLISSRNLYCDQLAENCILVLFTLGVLIGAFLSSKYADIIGRKFVAIISLSTFTIFTVLIVLVQNSYIMFICIFIMGNGAAAGTMSTFVLFFEVVDKESRNFFGTIINSSYAIAGLSYYALFYYTYQWYFIATLSSVVSLICCLLFLFVFTESPRYLYCANEYELSLLALNRIAHANNRKVELLNCIFNDMLTYDQKKLLNNELLSLSPENKVFINNELSSFSLDISNTFKVKDSVSYNQSKFLIKVLCSSIKLKKSLRKSSIESSYVSSKTLNNSLVKEKFIEKENLNMVENTNEYGFKDLLKYNSIKYIFLIVSFLWLIVAYAYYGQSYMQKDVGQVEVFKNGFIMFTAEFFSYISAGLIMQISFLGRTRTIGYSSLAISLSGIPLLIFNIKTIIYKVFLFIFRFFMCIIYTSLYTYTTEIYPTSIRSKGMGINLTFGRLATILVATTIQPMKHYAYISFIIIGFITFVIHFMLKETFNKPLVDEIFEVSQRNKLGIKNEEIDDTKSTN